MKKIENGFTLLKLLVVVLIIGILAAIALPQYQLAVDKSKFANFQKLATSIKTSCDNYYLIHNEYPSSFDKLDIDFSSSYQHTKYGGMEGCVIFDDSYCCVGKRIAGVQSQHVLCAENNYTFAFAWYNGKEVCIAANGNRRAQRLCENFGTASNNTSSNMQGPYEHVTNNGKKYTTYSLIK